MNSNAFVSEPLTTVATPKTAARTRRARLGRLAAHLAVVCGIVGATPIGAGAVTLVTPLVRAAGGSFIMCTATNGGTSPGQVIITARDAAGGDITGFTFCRPELAPGASCWAYITNDTPGSCSFEVRGKIRAAAVLLEVGTGRPVVALPATK
jgi:hypothetical protein